MTNEDVTPEYSGGLPAVAGRSRGKGGNDSRKERKGANDRMSDQMTNEDVSLGKGRRQMCAVSRHTYPTSAALASS